jgi:5'-nucleotidase
VLVGTTDVHGHVESKAEMLRLAGGETVAVERGGAALFGGYLANLRARYPGHVVLVDSGDMMQGMLVSNLGEGQVMMRAMNVLGYAAAAVGNHEFDFGPAGPAAMPAKPEDDPRGAIKARLREAHFPWLSCNIVTEDGKPLAPGVKPFTLIEVDGVRIGLVGGTSEDTPHTTLLPNLVGLRVEPLAPAVIRAAAAARAAGATVVVALVHAGGQCHRFDQPGGLADPASCENDSEVFRLARALAAAGEASRVDAIFGGHTHQGVAGVVAGIPVVQAFDYGRAFSRIDLTVERRTGRVVPGGVVIQPLTEICAQVTDEVASCAPSRARGRQVVPARYEGRPVVPDAKVQAVIAADVQKVVELRERRVGIRLETPIGRTSSRAESPLGHLVADVIREATHADVGMTNGGGLRADLPAGELTYGSLFETLPFDNRLATLRMSGVALRALLGRNLMGNKGVLNVSGVRVEARCEGEKLVVLLRREDGQPLEDAGSYLVGVNDFLALGGDDFGGTLAALPADAVHIDAAGPTLRDVVAMALGRRGGTLRADEPRLATPRMMLPGPRPILCGGGSPGAGNPGEVHGAQQPAPHPAASSPSPSPSSAPPPVPPVRR